MAWHLQDRCPGKTYAILEAREASGGTWDLFRYPGVRSDSDMQTLGYRFKPWTGSKALADGPSILQYVRETAAENGIDAHIRYGHKVARAEWSTPESRWTVQIEGREPLTCQMLLMCSGYYRYDEGFTPPFEGREVFAGEVVHPQFWPQDFDPAGKRIVVIGSGATAVTIVPALAHLHPLDARRGRDRQRAATAARRAAVVCGRALEERHPANAALPAQPALPPPDAQAVPRRRAAPTAYRLRGRHPLQPALQAVGPAAVPGPQRRPLRDDLERERGDRHRRDRTFHRARHPPARRL